jgi:hypothetical protein
MTGFNVNFASFDAWLRADVMISNFLTVGLAGLNREFPW